MRGQVYDNGSSMSGKHIGLQKRISDNYPRALFTPCIKIWPLMMQLKFQFQRLIFSVMYQQLIYNFLSGPPFRWHVLKKNVKSLTLKHFSETRWEARVEAVKLLPHELGEINDSFVEIAEECSMATVRHEDECLSMKIKSYKLICSIKIWYDILEKVAFISEMVQKVSWNISSCAESIKEVLKFVKSIRYYESFENYFQIFNEL